MDRRTLLKMGALAGLAVKPSSRIFGDVTSELTAAETVHTVLLVTKCHLDIGFSRTQENVIREYFDVYYPAAIKIASEMRSNGADRYTWTTGSWLLYEYLEQANPAERKAMEHALDHRDIAWHALPFSWQTEMIDRSMISGALGFSQALDRRFGMSTTGAKMTDVPGHSRGIIGPLADAGVRLLDIGVNAASTPPDVPEFFLWKDFMGNSVAVLYHLHDYGGTAVIPRAGIAIDVEVRSDNSGPHTLPEIAAIYRKLRVQFPNAKIKAATMTDVAAAVDTVRGELPVVTKEIGDTWIYGCSSDPQKVSRYRCVARSRNRWIAQTKFASGDATDRKLLGRLLLAAEHTWGTDTKTYLDDQHYTPASLAKVLDQSGYVTMESSWKEKRDDIDAGIATLPEELQKQAFAELAAMTATPPETVWMNTRDPALPIETRLYTIAFDPLTGAIKELRNKSTGTSWASAQHPICLFTYQTLSPEQYASFMKQYITIESDWAPKDFGKPGIQAFGAVHSEWHPTIVRCFSSNSDAEERVVLEMVINDPMAQAKGNVAWPRQVFVELHFPAEEARIDFRVTTLGKEQNRLPEAMWLTFRPADIAQNGWELDKVNQIVSATDIVAGGGRNMHAVTDFIRCRNGANQSFELHISDATVIALGERSPLNYSQHLPDLALGAHVCLFNNAWGTNYPQWCGGDWLYRFQLYA